MTYVEIDLSEFGNNELREIAELINAYFNSVEVELPIKIGFNQNSGYVFIIDGNEKTFMVNSDGDLEEFLTCSDCRNEGLESEFEADQHCLTCCELVDMEYKGLTQ